MHRTIVVVDVEGFGDPHRTGLHQVGVRDGLYRCLRRAFSRAGIPWTECDHEDRGDGVFILAPADLPKSRFVESLPGALVEALGEHNENHPMEQRIRLRMALHAGEIRYDPHGATSTAINLAFRLLDAAPLKSALAESPGVLALIVSSWFFDEVVRDSPDSEPARYSRATIAVKETTATAWIRLPDGPLTTDDTAAVMVPPRAQQTIVPRQLPAPPAPFVGRIQEMAQLSELLGASPQQREAMVVAVIGGMGGIGKTWLALHWAHDNAHLFPDGQLYVDLRGFDPSGSPTSPATAVRGFLDALHLRPAAIPIDFDSQVALYRSLVSGRRMLIVLDNARDSAQVAPLLPGGPTCTVLVTSRHRMVGLVTAHGARHLTLDVLDRAEALQLLTNRLGHSRIANEPDAVGRLLTYCAGLPLALGITAAHAAVHADFDLAVLAEGLDEASARLDVLDSGDLSASLRAVLSWSYRTLRPEAANLFRLLGLLPGPDISVAAAACLAALTVPRVSALLHSLENAHLVQQLVPGRFRMHDIVRLYAADRVAAEGYAADATAALRRLVGFYLHTAHAGERLLYPDRKPITVTEPAPRYTVARLRDDPTTMSWFDMEHLCLLAAQSVAAEQGWHRLVWQLAWALHGYLWRRGHIRDQLATWRAGLAAAERLRDPVLKAMAHRLLGQALARAGMRPEASRHLRRALKLAANAGDAHGTARAHYDLARMGRNGDHQIALTHATQALRLFDALANPVWRAEALAEVGWHQARLGRYAEARDLCEQALELFREHANRQGVAGTLDVLGYVAHRSGQYHTALAHYRDALALCRDLGATYDEADTLDHLGHAYAALSQHAEARRVWQQAMKLSYAQHRIADTERLQRQLTDLVSPQR